jgi:hypothetical protein
MDIMDRDPARDVVAEWRELHSVALIVDRNQLEQ